MSTEYFFPTKKTFLKKGDIAYTTGAFIRWNGKWWEVIGFEDDTYYDGCLVNDIETKPYIGGGEE